MKEEVKTNMRGEDRVGAIGARRIGRREFLKGGLAIAGALGVAPALTACGGALSQQGSASAGGSGEGGEQIAFSFAYTDLPISGTLKDFARQKANELGVQFVTDNPRGNLQDHIASLESLIMRGVAGMTVQPIEPDSYEELARRAREQGIVWVTYSLEMENQDAAILFPPEQSGEVLAEDAVRWINENLDGEAEVLILSYDTNPIGPLRTKALEELIPQETNARIVAKQDAHDPTNGLRVTEDVLEANPNLNVVVGMNDDGALGALQAFRNAGKDPERTYIGGQDGSREALLAIRDGGHYKATSALSILEVANATIEVPKRIMDGGPRENVEIPAEIVSQETPEKIEEYLANYE
jgi:ABC-type sugar transport system substrate-binding protein